MLPMKEKWEMIDWVVWFLGGYVPIYMFAGNLVSYRQDHFEISIFGQIDKQLIHIVAQVICNKSLNLNFVIRNQTISYKSI